MQWASGAEKAVKPPRQPSARRTGPILRRRPVGGSVRPAGLRHLVGPRPRPMALQPEELIVDLFAGGGGASLGIEQALGRSPDIAINHDPEAVALHQANHPGTLHFCKSVWNVHPLDALQALGRGLRVGLLWASPDCKHFSKAKGGTPVSPRVRDLAWVVKTWAEQVRPRVICLENVEEFTTWGPVIATVDGKFVPCPARKGETFKRFVKELVGLGYEVEWRERRAYVDGAPTIRRRLYMIARCDGAAIEWPDELYGDPASEAVRSGRLRPWRTAADCIDWSLPCPSIFLTREEARAINVKRPLVENTMARIAAGVWRYVINCADPFIIPVTHAGDTRTHAVREPLRTLTTARRGEHALVMPTLVAYYGPGTGSTDRSAPVTQPLRTDTTGNRHALVTAFLAQHNTGAVGHRADAPLSTIMGRGTNQAIISAGLLNLKGSHRGWSTTRRPAPTICAQGEHLAEVRAFLVKYYGAADHGQTLGEPLHTDTTKPRFGLVMVDGEPHEIVDIGMRMLTPRERYRAQGFPDSYRIDITVEGKRLAAEAQGRMVGNSVCPPCARRLVAAQFGVADNGDRDGDVRAAA